MAFPPFGMKQATFSSPLYCPKNPFNFWGLSLVTKRQSPVDSKIPICSLWKTTGRSWWWAGRNLEFPHLLLLITYRISVITSSSILPWYQGRTGSHWNSAFPEQGGHSRLETALRSPPQSTQAAAWSSALPKKKAYWHRITIKQVRTHSKDAVLHLGYFICCKVPDIRPKCHRTFSTL